MAVHTAERLPADCLGEITLAQGAHNDRAADTVCAMEAVAWMAGEKHTDHPTCASPVIAAFMRSWNDALPSNNERDRLLKPLLPLLLNTRTSPADETTRAWLVTDWLVRVQAPAWMSLSDVLKEHSEKLRALAPITDAKSAKKAQPTIDAARTASAAAWDAAWDAARAAAGDAARAAAGDAARAAAWDAARDAARAAARAKLAPTVSTLQDSAVELVKTMCAVGKEAKAEPVAA